MDDADDADDAATDLALLLNTFVAGRNGEDPIPGIEDCMERLADYPQWKMLEIIKSMTDDFGNTAVYKMARLNMNITLGILLDRLGAQHGYELLKGSIFFRTTPIHVAVKNVDDRTLTGMLGVLQTIDEKIEILRIQNWKGDTAIHYAVRAGNQPSMEIMLQFVDQGTINELLQIRNAEGETAVFGGIRKGNMEIVRYMLESVAADDRVNLLRMENVQGNALHYTAWAGHVMPYGLIEHQSDLFDLMEENNKCGRTPIHCAMSQGHANVVEAMLTAVKRRGCYSDTHIMRVLQDVDENGDMPLHSAAAAGHLNAIERAMHGFGPDRQQHLLGWKNRREETVVQTAIATRDRLHGTIELLNMYNGSTDDTTTSVQGWCSI